MVADWIIFALLGGIFSNTFNFFSRFYLKDEDDATVYAWFFETFRLLLFISLAFFDFRLVLDLRSAVLLLLLGLTEFISVYFYMKMHAYSELSISSIISRARMIWIPVVAFILFGERLNILQYLGIIILFFGLSIALSPKRFFLDKGAIYANLAALVIAINVVILKILTPLGSIPVLTVALSLPSFFLFPLVMKNSLQRISQTFKKKFLIKFLAVVANAASAYLLIFALQKGEVSIVNALYQGTIILAVIAGIIFFREREDIFKKLLGATITVVGVILLT